jgi:hypothetical protein
VPALLGLVSGCHKNPLKTASTCGSHIKQAGWRGLHALFEPATSTTTWYLIYLNFLKLIKVLPRVWSCSLFSLTLRLSMHKLQLSGRNLGWVFNIRSGHLHAAAFLVSPVKLPNLRIIYISEFRVRFCIKLACFVIGLLQNRLRYRTNVNQPLELKTRPKRLLGYLPLPGLSCSA